MFKSARIKLTSWYLLIIMTVTLLFSTVVYTSVVNTAERALEMHERRMNMLRTGEMPRNPMPPPRFQQQVTEETIQNVKQRTMTLLGAANLVILLVSGSLGYWLAGKTLEPIEQMTEKQKIFIADAAHELKTPLTSIKTHLEVNLRNKKLNLTEAKKIFSDTIEDIDSLTYLTNSLLAQSKHQNYNNGNDFEEFYLNEEARKIITKLKPKADQKKLFLNLKLEDVKIKADKKAVSELITILVDNAIKFNKEKGTVDIEIFKEKKCAVIKIQDTGIGIEKKDLPHIFDRFYKASSSRSKVEHDGFGLGLSIAKEITGRHKGKISVRSRKDEGTVFNVNLPLGI